jgi:hypothetical protein
MDDIVFMILVVLTIAVVCGLHLLARTGRL